MYYAITAVAFFAFGVFMESRYGSAAKTAYSLAYKRFEDTAQGFDVRIKSIHARIGDEVTKLETKIDAVKRII